MRSFLSMSANRLVDEYAIQSCGIPGETLMQAAGIQIVEQLKSRGLLDSLKHILVLAGKGNNGGDGFVVARQLATLGKQVHVIMAASEDALSGDAKKHFNNLNSDVIKLDTWDGSGEQRKLFEETDLIVDALLGTGVKGEIRSPYSEIIPLCNQSPAPVIAVDVPSGVSGDRGAVLKSCIQASLTISMGFGKQGCLFEPARRHCGQIDIVDIGFPADSISQVKDQILYQLSAEDFPPANYPRPAESHKYSVGKVYIIAGSRGYSGAAILAASAALRSGAGLVKLAVPESLGSVAETLSPETIVEYMPETPDQCLSISAYDKLLEGCGWADVVALGPGLGRSNETVALLKKLIPAIKCPVVIDADALYALSEDLTLLSKRSSATVLTPHLGEFKRLLNKDVTYPAWQDALALSNKYGVHLLLKGAPSILTMPDNLVIVNSSGYAGMATAGSGDVLTGVLAALWAQWPQQKFSPAMGMYLHGRAAESRKADQGVLGLIASDIVEALPAVLKEYGGEQS